MPGTRLEALPEDNSIPVMLVQRSIGPEYVDKDHKGRSDKNAIFGWTVIVPSGWGGPFWHSLAFADTRIGGLRERAQQFFEAGCPSFPEDYACTHAFKIEIDKKAKEASAHWHRTPVAKRVNYDKLQTTSPWRPAFSEISRSLISTCKPRISVRIADVLPSENGIAPHLVGGSVIGKFLAAAIAKETNKTFDEQFGYQEAQDIYRESINTARDKRNLPPVKPYLVEAFAKVRLTPLTRGSPKYNAIIYMPDENQVYGLRHILKMQNLENADGKSRPPNMNLPSGITALPEQGDTYAGMTEQNVIMDDWEQALLKQPEPEVSCVAALVCVSH